ncbi:hypothetical protein, partial [Pseudomonas syringae]|uniref:hypothetical protein n=1 Tax=Pseudomonas syringae TaxID=317 RepID=UPI001F208BC6
MLAAYLRDPRLNPLKTTLQWPLLAASGNRTRLPVRHSGSVTQFRIVTSHIQKLWVKCYNFFILIFHI